MERFGHLLNLPDLQFSQLCQQQFSLNKGIYNTVDCWFYNNGVINILERRTFILEFMLFNAKEEVNAKFGPGGLSRKLEDFWNQKSGKLQLH